MGHRNCLEEMVLQLHGLVLHPLPQMVVKWGMDPNGYRASSTYTMGDEMARYGNNDRKVNDVTKSKWKKVFWGSHSQCIYRMVQGLLTHGILLSMVFIYGILTHSHF